MKLSGLGLSGIITMLFLLASCGKKDAVKTEDKKDVAQATELSVVYDVDLANSSLGWKGTKVGKEHVGTIGLQGGTISIEKNAITAGSFMVDMKTIKNTDLSEENGNSKLVEHLMGADFFDAEKYPTSKFEITGSEKLASPDSSGNNYSIMGNLTIKDVTKNITIAAKIEMDSTQFTATSKFNIDRSEFNVQYASGKFFKNLGDKAIGDIIEYDLILKATPKK